MTFKDIFHFFLTVKTFYNDDFAVNSNQTGTCNTVDDSIKQKIDLSMF